MEADTGIWGAIVGGGLGIIGALVGIYCATRGVVNMIFSDESLTLEQRRDRIINYANFTFIMAFFAALWIMVSAANWIFRPFRDSPALSLTATLSLVLVPWFIMAAVTYFTKGGRELLKMSYGDVKN